MKEMLLFSSLWTWKVLQILTPASYTIEESDNGFPGLFTLKAMNREGLSLGCKCIGLTSVSQTPEYRVFNHSRKKVKE